GVRPPCPWVDAPAVVETDLHFLKILRDPGDAGRHDRREHAAADDRDTGHAADIGNVANAEAEVIVFDLQRPGRGQSLLDADARGPAQKCPRLRIRIGELGDAAHVPRHVDVIDRPADAALAVDERVTEGPERIADARRHSAGSAWPAFA